MILTNQCRCCREQRGGTVGMQIENHHGRAPLGAGALKFSEDVRTKEISLKDCYPSTYGTEVQVWHQYN